MDAPDRDIDPQDQAEVYDETHVDDDGLGETDFEEMEPVLDVTRQAGDAYSREFSNSERQSSRHPDRAIIEAQADALLGVQHHEIGDNEVEGEIASSPDEIDLVYTGLMRNQRGAQASAAHWEAKRLSDSDLDQLGYSPDSIANKNEENS